MRLVVAGKSWIGCSTLEYAASLPVEVVALPAESDADEDTWQPSFRRAAERLGLPVATSVADSRPDVLLSVEYDRIIRLPDLGGGRAYNVHFSLLPAYRGGLTSVWPIRNGERESGVTLHVMTAGIDDGPIIDQRAIPIGPDWTAFELYRVYHDEAKRLVRRWLLPLLNEGDPPSQPQDELRASYYSRTSIDLNDTALRDFDHSASEVRDWVRSLIFPPYQLPRWQGREIEAVRAVEKSATPGEVLIDEPDRAVIGCVHGVVELTFRSGAGADRREVLPDQQDQPL